jgi:hypothetical protein
MGYEKIFTETTSKDKLKMRHWVNLNCQPTGEFKVYMLCLYTTPVFHTGIKVMKIITKVMMLRLLLTTGPAAGAKVEYLVV